MPLEMVKCSYVPLVVLPFEMVKHFGCRKEETLNTFLMVQPLSHCISLAAVLKGTNNIHGSLVVGDSGFGNVYRGIVTDGTIAAVNRNNPMFRQGLRKFQNDIKML